MFSQPAFTRIINPSAIYDINPVTEDVAKQYANNLQVAPIEAWDINKFMQKVEQKKLELQAAKSDDSGEYNPGEAYEERRDDESKSELD